MKNKNIHRGNLRTSMATQHPSKKNTPLHSKSYLIQWRQTLILNWTNSRSSSYTTWRTSPTSSNIGAANSECRAGATIFQVVRLNMPTDVCKSSVIQLIKLDLVVSALCMSITNPNLVFDGQKVVWLKLDQLHWWRWPWSEDGFNSYGTFHQVLFKMNS